MVVPLLFGLILALGAIDWTALSEAMKRGGDDVMSRIEGAGLAPAAVIAVLSIGWSVLAVAVLYPVFQAMVLRWWISGLRFGELSVASHLRTGAVYAIYLRFMWIALVAGVVFAIGAAIAFAIAGGLTLWLGKGVLTRTALDCAPDRILCRRCARLFDDLPGDSATAPLEGEFRVDRAVGRLMCLTASTPQGRRARRSVRGLPTRSMSAGFEHGDSWDRHLLRRRDQRAAAGACRALPRGPRRARRRKSARCSCAGLTTSSIISPRRTAYCGSAAPARRGSRASKCATRR